MGKERSWTISNITFDQSARLNDCRQGRIRGNVPTQSSTYHEVLTSVKIGEVIGVAFKNESSVVKVVFVSVDAVKNSGTKNQTGGNGLPVGLKGLQGAAEDLRVGSRQEVAALDLGRASESRQFRGGSSARL